MAERREEEEGEEGARRWSSGGLYRPRSSWARDVATGGGRFGSGAHDGERAELQRRGAGRGVSWRLGERPGTRVRVRRCQEAGQVALGDFVHRRRTAGGGRNRASREREMEIGSLLRFLKIPGTSR